ncbi:TonB-dependent receptor plug domain-containing protein [Sphingomonas sp. IW22]|jgi:outer membrane receptor protein involved in Fe transport|uniref:TonB-dependent receptor plug domain-containing protein n=1 Tax=Sphingomonas sp. IW22 TaxID=3242489 RepID=UPI0035214253
MLDRFGAEAPDDRARVRMGARLGRFDRHFSASLIALAVSAASAPALAQVNRCAAGEDCEIVVTATGLDTATSSTKTDTPLIETPQTISVITRTEMDVRAVDSISDALAYVAGVQAQPSGIDSRVDEVNAAIDADIPGLRCDRHA